MATVRERDTMTTVRRGRSGATRPSRLRITLADLITAIQGPERDAPPVALRLASRVQRMAGSYRERRRSITGKEVMRDGRTLIGHWSGRGAGGFCRARRSDPLPAPRIPPQGLAAGAVVLSM
jgi:hypothetical protein